MSTDFLDNSYSSNFKSPSQNKVQSFLNDLRTLLNTYDVKLYSHDCEVYIKGQGYIGYLEDNVETVEIVEGEETLYSSYKSITSDDWLLFLF